MTWTRAALIVYLVFLFGFAFSSTAEAYLDPGSGSYVCQMLIAALLGGFFVLKLYWTRIKTTLAGFFSKDP